MSEALVPTPLPTQAAPADLAPSLADRLSDALTHADTIRRTLVEAGDLDALAHGLADIRRMRSELAIFESVLDGDVSTLNLGATGPVVIDGLGALETRRRSSKVKWDSEALFGRLVDRICDEAFVDPHTGEAIGDPATADRIRASLRDRLAKAVPLTPSMGWRIGGLKEAGIDADEYRTRELGAYSTRIIGPSGAA